MNINPFPIPFSIIPGAIQQCVRDYRVVNDGAPIDIFSDPGFAFFRKVLDAEMIELQAEGIGLKPKQAEPISNSNEDRL